MAEAGRTYRWLKYVESTYGLRLSTSTGGGLREMRNIILEQVSASPDGPQMDGGVDACYN